MSKVVIIVLAYLVLINIVAFILYGIDKRHAERRKKRISSSVLLWMARLGGGIGCWLAMSYFHHKKNHSSFNKLIPRWIIIWMFVFVLLVIITSGNPADEMEAMNSSMINF